MAKSMKTAFEIALETIGQNGYLTVSPLHQMNASDSDIVEALGDFANDVKKARDAFAAATGLVVPETTQIALKGSFGAAFMSARDEAVRALKAEDAHASLEGMHKLMRITIAAQSDYCAPQMS